MKANAVHTQKKNQRGVATTTFNQSKSLGQIIDNRPQQFKLHVSQFKRERGEEEEDSKQLKAFSPLQRVVRKNIPNDTKIIIDNPAAGDFGETGKIIRDSRSVDNCKVVEFDLEPGEFYRVMLHEMSATDKKTQQKFGGPALFEASFNNGNDQIGMEMSVEITDGESQQVNVKAYNGKIQIGHLGVLNDANGFQILSIYANDSPEHSISGLGTLLLKISAELAKKMGALQIKLAAHREGQELHPAPFYEKFGFAASEEDHLAAAQQIGMSFEDYSKMLGISAVAMSGDVDTVNDETGNYLGRKNWR